MRRPVSTERPGSREALPSGLELRRQPAIGGACIFRREGEYWTIAYEGSLVRLRDAKGLQYIARLLRRPGESIPARALLGEGREAVADADLERARLAVTKRIKEALKKVRTNHPALGDHLTANVRTGRSCAYDPGPARRMSWRL